MRKIERNVEKALLASANEDYCGLYEAVWEVNSMFPELPLADKYRLAQAALESLLKKGLIRLERRTATGKDRRYEVVGREDTARVLSNPTSWYPEYPENVQVGFSATDKGREVWEQQ